MIEKNGFVIDTSAAAATPSVAAFAPCTTKSATLITNMLLRGGTKGPMRCRPAVHVTPGISLEIPPEFPDLACARHPLIRGVA
jgi:hypothetical protein